MPARRGPAGGGRARNTHSGTPSLIRPGGHACSRGWPQRDIASCRQGLQTECASTQGAPEQGRRPPGPSGPLGPSGPSGPPAPTPTATSTPTLTPNSDPDLDFHAYTYVYCAIPSAQNENYGAAFDVGAILCGGTDVSMTGVTHSLKGQRRRLGAKWAGLACAVCMVKHFRVAGAADLGMVGIRAIGGTSEIRQDALRGGPAGLAVPRRPVLPAVARYRVLVRNPVKIVTARTPAQLPLESPGRTDQGSGRSSMASMTSATGTPA